jgi:hypothetical protein
MRAVTTLPSGYRSSRTITFSHNPGLLIGLNLAGVVLFVAFGLLFLFLAGFLSPAFTRSESGTVSGWGLVLIPVVLIGSVLFTLIVHELTHGLFFWIFTRKRPTFGFKGFYAYAAAPEFYIPRNQFILIGLAPFVVMSLVGIALLPFTSLGVALTIVLILTMNAAGAVGDFYAVGVLLTRPSTTLIRDFGDGMACYQPE